VQVISLLGEGGFAKVFRGEWRGLVVAVKVVADDATNDKLVMKNAHEIAILASLSHPNIIQVRGRAACPGGASWPRSAQQISRGKGGLESQAGRWCDEPDEPAEPPV
jgi:hypothetical protein